VQSGNVTFPPTRSYVAPLYVTVVGVTDVGVDGPPVPGPAKLPELEPLLDPDELLEPEELLLELDELLEPEELPELELPPDVQPGATPAGIIRPLSMTMYTVQSGNVTLPLTRAYVAPL